MSNEQQLRQKYAAMRWAGILPAGLAFGLAGYIGMANRSWSGFGGIAAFATFFLVGSFLSDVRQQYSGRARKLAGYGNLAWFSVLLFALLSGVELIAFNNADWYPATFAKKMGRATGWEEYQRKLEAECGPRFSMGVLKEGGRLFVRCGGNMWFDGKTLVFDNDPLAR